MKILVFCQVKQSGYKQSQKISFALILEVLIEIIKLTNKNVPKSASGFLGTNWGKYIDSAIRAINVNKTNKEFGFNKNKINSLKELLLKIRIGR